MNQLAEVAQSRSPAKSSNAPNGGPMGWLRSEIDRLFDDFSGPTTRLFQFAPQFNSPVPAIELIDGKKEYQLSVELPGMTDKDVEVAVADGVLTISGEKKEESERKDDGYLLSERRYGGFKRQITLPADVKPDDIKARFSNGVLKISLGKDANAKGRPHKIAIES